MRWPSMPGVRKDHRRTEPSRSSESARRRNKLIAVAAGIITSRITKSGSSSWAAASPGRHAGGGHQSPRPSGRPDGVADPVRHRPAPARPAQPLQQGPLMRASKEVPLTPVVAASWEGGDVLLMNPEAAMWESIHRLRGSPEHTVSRSTRGRW